MSSKLKVNNIIPSTGTQIGISTTGGGINLLTGTVVTGIITASGSTIDDWIVHAGDTNTKFGFLSNDVFEVHTAGSERIRIEADGHTQVGVIGLSGGNDHGLTVTEPGGTANVLELATTNASGRINFSRNLSSTLNTTSYIEWQEPGAQGTGSIRFGTSPSSNAPVTRLEITSGGGLKFRSADSPTNNSEPALWLNHSGGMQLYASSAEGSHRNIIFSTNDRSAGERLRITSTGLVGISTNAPIAALLDIATASGSNDHLRLRRLSSDSNVATNWSLKPYAGNLYFRSGGSSDKIYFDDSGDIAIMDGNLVIGTAGHGIDFSAQTASSATGATNDGELLDHYERGTWNPGFQTSNSNWSGGVNVSNGNFIRIGRLVYIFGRVSWSSTGGTGNMQIIHLPFSIANGSDYDGQISVGYREGVSYPRVHTSLSTNANRINLHFVDSSAPYNSGSIVVGALQSSGSIYFAGCYYAY